MNGGGLFVAVAGVWVLAQVLAGDALDRLGIFGGHRQQSSTSTAANILLNPGAPENAIANAVPSGVAGKVGSIATRVGGMLGLGGG